MSGFTIDASVFGNATIGGEAGHASSAELIRRAQASRVPLLLPTLLLTELAGLIARRFDDEETARRVIERLLELNNARFVGLGVGRSQRVARLAARSRLRGADAVYVEIAIEHGSTLVTRDREQQERASALVPVSSPEGVLEAWAEHDRS